MKKLAHVKWHYDDRQANVARLIAALQWLLMVCKETTDGAFETKSAMDNARVAVARAALKE